MLLCLKINPVFFHARSFKPCLTSLPLSHVYWPAFTLLFKHSGCSVHINTSQRRSVNFICSKLWLSKIAKCIGLVSGEQSAARLVYCEYCPWWVLIPSKSIPTWQFLTQGKAIYPNLKLSEPDGWNNLFTRLVLSSVASDRTTCCMEIAASPASAGGSWGQPAHGGYHATRLSDVHLVTAEWVRIERDNVLTTETLIPLSGHQIRKLIYSCLGFFVLLLFFYRSQRRFKSLPLKYSILS